MVLTPLLAALVSGSAQSVPVQSGTFQKSDIVLKTTTLTPQMRMDAARKSFEAGAKFSSAGSTRVRKVGEKGSTFLSLGANTCSSYRDGVVTMAKGSALWIEFSAKKDALYAVALIGRFDCNAITWAQEATRPAQASLVITPGDASALIGVKAADKRPLLWFVNPSGDKGRFALERVEVTELN